MRFTLASGALCGMGFVWEIDITNSLLSVIRNSGKTEPTSFALQTISAAIASATGWVTLQISKLLLSMLRALVNAFQQQGQSTEVGPIPYKSKMSSRMAIALQTGLAKSQIFLPP